MFDLNHEVDQWCRSIIDYGCAGNSALDELKDHLHCLVEENADQGMNTQQAFVKAIKQMGDSDQISKEYRSNQSLLQKMAAYDKRLQTRIGKRFTVKQLSWFMIIYSLLCAVMMVMSSTVFPQHYMLLNNLILAVWFVPYILAASVPSIRKAECAMLKNLFRRN